MFSLLASVVFRVLSILIFISHLCGKADKIADVRLDKQDLRLNVSNMYD